MRIETIRVQNFKALQDVELKNLPSFCVFVGKNGSGKTTLFRVLAFLKTCLEQNVTKALISEGGMNGFREIVTRGHAQESIKIEIQFRMEIAGSDRLVTYSLEIAQDSKNLPVVRREQLCYERGTDKEPFYLLDFENGEGYSVINEEDYTKPADTLKRKKFKLNSADVLAIKGFGQFEAYPVPRAIAELLESVYWFDFHTNDARGVKDYEDAVHLSASGSNLPAFARYMFEQHPKEVESVKQKMRDRIPGISNIEVKVTEDGRLLVRYQDGAFSEPFIDKNVSDGTVKMFAYLLLLHDPKPHPVLCIEEPENQLYPQLMTLLAEEFLQYAERGGQVFVSTHSPQLLNAVPLESIFHIDKANGVSRIVAISEDPLLSAQIKAGDKAGYLWEQGMFRGLKQRIEQK